MIKRYRYGQPIPTDTIVKEIPICNESIAFFQLENKKKKTFTYTMDDNDIIYGLGENMRGINKRGFTYIFTHHIYQALL